MLSASLYNNIKNFLSDKLGSAITSLEFIPVGGGSINQTFKLTTNTKHHFFCKINSSTEFPLLFQKEKNGLELLGAQKIIRVPEVLGLLEVENQQVLVLEWIDQEVPNDRFWEKFGISLAMLHQVSSPVFGLEEDNYMGALPQYNQFMDNWADFFIRQRLEPQVKLAVDKGLLSGKESSEFEKVYRAISSVFPSSVASLLHGDLWSGNFLCDDQYQPVLIDPACYYGDRSIDLGMSTLFGGFDGRFYDSYMHFSILPLGYKQQWELCNLYPLLIHLNLFGRSYLASILHTIKRY